VNALSLANAATPDPKFPISTPQSSPTSPAQQFSAGSDWLNARYAQIEKDLNGGVELAKVHIVFVGDSITQFWIGWDGLTDRPLWASTFGATGSDNYALNLGVSGDCTENTLLRLLDAKSGGFGELDDPLIQPEIFVFMLGINNIWHTDEPVVEKIVAGDLAVIARLHQLRPSATIVVNSMLPTANPSEVARYVAPVNARLEHETKALGPNIRWLNLFPAFLRADGSQNPVLFRDGVHLTLKGYETWRAELLPVLNAIRATRA
jgi:lysophospholipase L1-like esterase